jgi:hypothetical protein
MATAASRRKALEPDPIPLAMQPGDEVLVLMPVTVVQRMRDGSILVRGSGVNKFARPEELLRHSDIIRGRIAR